MNLNQITVPTLDVRKAITFYQKLGLKLIVHTSDDYARFECENGASFSLHLVDQLPQGNGIYVYFECENLDERVKELLAQGIEFEMMPTDQTWLWREARLKDLDGNQIILFFAGENRLNPPWKLK
ncbi:VOC family protein [Flammeovirga sp. SJP92]|uniref:VOC family protein n=1 Tax=Flammeovirga sp. SJP92 TaxID=1775430 RepID=UPI00078936F2|nr:glyoxalase/bleomycin resistance/extradiol dioxygenase family protein [Flammeovirga sp. SJP92]KXX68888.1 bleomycin resistance protein [Flammeovirga sp. SJP92]